MLHFMKLNPQPFNQIACGNKTIELRLFDEKRQKIKIGDTIEFTSILNPDQKLKAVVKNLYKFPSFLELYQNLPLEKCGYSKEQIKTASHKDMEEYYSLEQQKNYGVLGIEIEVI